jgi:hypothetical protein
MHHGAIAQRDVNAQRVAGVGDRDVADVMVLAGHQVLDDRIAALRGRSEGEGEEEAEHEDRGVGGVGSRGAGRLSRGGRRQIEPRDDKGRRKS